MKKKLSPTINTITTEPKKKYITNQNGSTIVQQEDWYFSELHFHRHWLFACLFKINLNCLS